MHSKNFLHRDLHVDNVLWITSEGRDTPETGYVGREERRGEEEGKRGQRRADRERSEGGSSDEGKDRDLQVDNVLWITSEGRDATEAGYVGEE
jgi:hypothetical protein